MTFRYARHTSDLRRIEDFYTRIVQLEKLGEFKNHNVYDGIFLGLPDADWHLEFTASNHKPIHQYDDDDIMVFYVYSTIEMDEIEYLLQKSNIQTHKPRNPYWIENGIMVSDPDGHKLIFARKEIKLISNDMLTQLVLKHNLRTWSQLIHHVQRLPYGRNANRSDFSLVMKEGKGTCSSKHAFLQRVAEMNQIENVKLIMGMYMMNHLNTPKIGNAVLENGLDYIPEAHCYPSMRKTLLLYSFLLFLFIQCSPAKEKVDVIKEDNSSPCRIIAYYAGPPDLIDSFDYQNITHLIFSFGHLKGNDLHIGSAADSTTIKKMVQLKANHPDLKVMLSLGGWGGCESCSDVFNTKEGREEFAISLKKLSDYFKTDGIDLDWEYPAIPGPPGHTYRPEDRSNFTMLLQEIRKANGDAFEISFAAGGFTTFIQTSIDWKEVIRYTDFINIMTYDLVHGYSKTSGHHTPLYSTPQQLESTDHAITMLLDAGVPAEQLVIGAAFYGRFFVIEDGNPVDLYQPCHFSHGFSNRHRHDSLSGFELKWDSVAQAPYALHDDRKMLATYDDERSIALKTKYVKDKNLGGIMFWQLCDDAYTGGLLDKIDFRKK